MTCAAAIVVPLLRQPDEWLEKSIRSALAQSVCTEVIVVHSQSTPSSNLTLLSRIGQQCDNLSVLVEDKPKSFPGAINKGIRNATANRLGLLLADDWIEPTTVAECLAHQADIVSTGHVVHFADGRTNAVASGTRSRRRFLSLATLQEKAAYLGHFFLFRKETLLLAGGLDEEIGNYPGIDDYDLIWTLLERGATVAIVEKALYHYRDHDGERLTMSDPAKAVANLAKILRKHGVQGAAAREIIDQHARWYGKPIYRVLNQSRPS